MKFIKLFFAVVVVIILASSCNNSSENKTGLVKTGVTKKDWGIVDGKNVYLYTLAKR